MSERLTSFFILLGGALTLLALWYLSVMFVRRDTRRRAMGAVERRAWIAAAALLPLIGFALYLFTHLLRGYLNVVPEAEDEGRITAVKPRPVDWPAEIPQTSGDTFGGAEAASAGAEAYQNEQTVPAAALAGGPGEKTEVVPHRPLRGRYLLVASQGPYAGQQFDFRRLPLRLGRGGDANIALDDDLNVSRSHAELYAANGSLRIRDLGSTHGTQVNGVPVADQAVQPGDRISIGGTTFILRELPE